MLGVVLNASTSVNQIDAPAVYPFFKKASPISADDLERIASSPDYSLEGLQG
jgi:hypothetical protein